MKTETLRALQAPLKEHYHDDPKEAFITLRAQGSVGEGVTCKVETGRAMISAGLHPAIGGSFSNACSGYSYLRRWWSVPTLL